MSIGWATTAQSTRQCVLCGHAGPGVEHALIRWRDGDPFGSGPRCHDHDACHERCLANGDAWLVHDGRPSGVASSMGNALAATQMPDGSRIEPLDFGEASA